MNRPLSTRSGSSRRGRVLLILGVVIVALVVAAVALLPRLVDPERYRGRVETALRQATGWDAELGRLDLSILGGLALTVSPASLTAPGGDGSSVHVERIVVRAELWPLLHGNLIVRSIDLDAPDILLVRRTESQGYSLPGVGGGEAQPAGGSGTSGAGGLTVAIGRVGIRGGRLRVEDDVMKPPLRLDVREVSATIQPDAGSIEARGTVEGGGDLRLESGGEGGVVVRVTGLSTDQLAPLVGEGLMHPGGSVDGEVTFHGLQRIDARLTGRNLELLSGERPLADPVEATLSLSAAGGGWQLDSMKAECGEIRLDGSGRLTPLPALTVNLARSPLEATLAAARSVLPVDVDVEGPGTLEATLKVSATSGGTTALTARGEMTAARYRVADTLPSAENVHASFELDRAGRLVVDITEGTVAGGPLSGQATIASVSPLGKLSFDGDIVDASLGGLVGPLVADTARRLSGPADVDAALTVDLGRPTFDLRAVGGHLGLEANDVTLPGWDLEDAIRKAIEAKGGALAGLLGAFDGGKQPPAAQEQDTRIDRLAMRVDFDRWPWKLDSFDLAGGGIGANGKGTFDPEQGIVDVALTAALDADRTARLVQKSSSLRALVGSDGRLTLPVHVQGALVRPSIGVDLSGVLGKDLEQKGKDAVRGLLDRLKRQADKPKDGGSQ